MITRYHTGNDKKPAYERIRERIRNKPICQFGESVMYMLLDSPNADENKAEAKQRDGIWLGTKERTEEHLIGTNEGVVNCGTARRKPEEQQRNA